MVDKNNPWGNDSDNNRGFSGDSFKNFGDIFKKQSKFSNDNMPGQMPSKKLIVFLILIAAGIWLFSGFYVVNPEEQGIELLFGKYTTETGPGLNYNLPSPIGRSIKLKTATVNKELIGYNPANDGYNRSSKPEFLMLTGDENIVDTNFEVQWRIKNPKDYLFNVHERFQGSTVKDAAESAMREIIGKNSINYAMKGEGRTQIALETTKLIQEILNSYNMGVEILSIQMKNLDPPLKVINSFRDVQSARADKEREINQAQAYNNDVIPKARGKAVNIIQEAEAYKQEVINNSKGKADRFSSILGEYKKNKEITRSRMYLETMEHIFSSVDKVILDKDIAKGAIPYLPLTKDLHHGGKK